MRKVRHSAFETNSSSTHALVLPLDKVIDQTIGKSGRTITLKPEWDFHFKTNDPLEKAKFIYSAILYYLKGDVDKLNLLCTTVENHTGCKVILNNTGYYDFERGYLPDFILENEQSLKEFLFCSQSYIYYGNDSDLEDRINNDLRVEWEIHI